MTSLSLKRETLETMMGTSEKDSAHNPPEYAPANTQPRRILSYEPSPPDPSLTRV